MNVLDKYKKEAQKRFKMFYDRTAESEEDNHIVHVASSIMMTRDNVIQGGSFVQAFVDNKLAEAINRADDQVINHFRFLTNVKSFSYVE